MKKYLQYLKKIIMILAIVILTLAVGVINLYKPNGYKIVADHKISAALFCFEYEQYPSDIDMECVQVFLSTVRQILRSLF